MAMNYQNFASLGVNLNRQKYGPLDISNVFTSEADLKYYLSKGTFTTGVSEYWYKNANEKVVPYPYEGQVLATVIDGLVNVYVLTADTFEEDGTTVKTFKTSEIGAKVEVDGKTIKLNDAGKLELVGLPADIAGKTLVPSLVNGELTWAEPDTSTAEGQAQEIEGLKTRASALEATVNGTGEGDEHVEGLVDKVAALEAVDNATQAELDAYKEVVTAAIAAGVKEAKDYADAQDADTVYDDTALSARVKAIEDDYLKEEDKYDDTALAARVKAIEDDYLTDADKYDDTALAGRVTTAEGKIEALEAAVEAIDYVDSDELDAALAPINTDLATKAAQTDLEELEGRVDAFLTGTGATDALDSLQELIEYINTHDDTDINGILASIQALETKVDTGDQKVSEYVTAAIDALKIGDYAKAADLTALAGSVEALEAKPFDTYATKSEVEAVDAKFAEYTKTSDLNTALDGKVNTSDFETFKGENTTAIGAAKDAAIAAAKTETETQVGALEDAVAETYATKTELSEAVEGIENDLVAYAKTADVNAELAKKIETGSIAHSSESLAEGVTVDGTKLNIVVDAYTKQEVRDYVADVIEDMTGGESAADVLLALNNHIDTYTEKVGQIDAKDAAQDTAIAKAQEDATNGINDAAKVAGDLATANLAIAENTREIGVVDGKIDTVNNTLSEKITALEGKDTTIEGNITALQTLTSGHTTTITEHGTKIAALENRDTELAALIQGNTDKFANYSDTTAMNKAIADAIAAIPSTDLSKHATIEYVDGELAKKADASTVYTKDEADAEFMTQDEVDSRISALIDAANNEDTIKNLNDLVTYVNENASDIAALVSEVEAHDAKFEGLGADQTVKGYVDDAIAAIVMPKASTEVTIAEDGTLGIGEVSTDKLINGVDTFVIDGGNSVN